MSYTTNNGRIFRDIAEIWLHGINVQGFNSRILRPQYLWAMGWKEQLAQIAALGFNAVRVPFVPDTLHATAGEASTLHALNADLVGLTPLQTLDLWMAEADRLGLYIVLDFHSISRVNQYFHPFVMDPNDYGSGRWAETWNRQPYTVDDWERDLVSVALRYAHLPHFIGIDIFNEPRDRVRWNNPGFVSWKQLAENAADAILTANSNLLVFVQGLGNANFDGREQDGISINWGENFQPQAYAPLAIPADKLVLSPHSYGPDVFVKPTFGATNFPANLEVDWEILFGQFQGRYTVVPGEWGGRYGVPGGPPNNLPADPRDVAWQDAFVGYMIAKGITSSFYWCYTPNSGDTGGILADDLSVREDKLALLRRLWGSAPPVVVPPVVETPVVPVPPLTDTARMIQLLEQIEINTRGRQP